MSFKDCFNPIHKCQLPMWTILIFLLSAVACVQRQHSSFWWHAMITQYIVLLSDSVYRNEVVMCSRVAVIQRPINVPYCKWMNQASSHCWLEDLQRSSVPKTSTILDVSWCNIAQPFARHRIVKILSRYRTTFGHGLTKLAEHIRFHPFATLDFWHRKAYTQHDPA